MVAYSIGSGGALTQVASGVTGVLPSAVVLNNSGANVYVANRSDWYSTASGYSVANGTFPTAVSGSPFSSGSAVTALLADKSGNYLLAGANGGGSPDLTMYSFDQTTAGKLDFSTSTATGNPPTGAVAIAATH